MEPPKIVLIKSDFRLEDNTSSSFAEAKEDFGY